MRGCLMDERDLGFGRGMEILGESDGSLMRESEGDSEWRFSRGDLSSRAVRRCPMVFSRAEKM